MGWVDEDNKRVMAAGQVKRASATDDEPGYFTGFIASAVSSIPELFGQNPSETAAEFREENPISGVVSSLAGTAVPYLGVMKLSTLPKAAALLEGTVARTGLTALENPVAYGVLKETLRFAPFEAGRLGVGLMTDEGQENYGSLLADVGLSVALTGGFGAIGGLFRAGGKVDPVTGMDSIVGSDYSFRDTFMLRAAREPGALTRSGQSVDEFIPQLAREVFLERPDTAVGGKKWVNKLEGGTPESDAGINSLWKGAKGNTGYYNQVLVEGMESDLRTLNVGEGDAFAKALGFQDMPELASYTVYPRRVVVNSERGAGDFMSKIEKSAMQPIGDGTWMAREADDGLFVIAKKVRSGVAEDGAKPVNSLGGAVGDQWLIAKTDQPGRFAPNTHKLAQATVADWAKQRGAWVPTAKTDTANRAMDMTMEALSPLDARDLTRTGRVSAVGKIANNLGKKFGEVSGLEGSRTVKAMAGMIHDWVKPAMFQAADNALFGRLFALQKAAFGSMHDVTNRIIGGVERMHGTPSEAIRGKNVTFESGFNGHRPVQQIVKGLTHEDIQVVAQAGIAQWPAEAVEALVRQGAVSPAAQRAIAELQAINKDFIEKEFLPAIADTVVDGKFKPLEGYFIPRVWEGEWRSQVLDELGNPVWLGAGKTTAAAKQQADLVVAEAKARGLNWTREEAKHLVQGDRDALNVLSDTINHSVAKSRDVQEIVQAAMQKSVLARSNTGIVPRVRQLGGFSKERTGRLGSPDVKEYTADDIVKSVQDHYGNLGRVAAYHSWQKRFGQEAINLEKIDKTLYTNLLRKANQQLGIEGSGTQWLNKTLTPVFGHMLGGKAATRIAQGTNELMANWNLMIANPTHALLNLLSPLQTVAPWISFMTSAPSEKIAQYYQFLPKMGADGLPRGTVGVLHPMKVLAQATKMLREPTPELKSVLEQLKTEGTISARLYEGWVGGQAASHMTIKEVFEQQGSWQGIRKIATYMAEKSEEYARMTSANAAYILGKDFFGLEGDKLLQFTRKGVEATNYGYGVVDRSRMFTGPIGSMFGLFKNWQFHFIGQTMQYANVAVNQNVWGPLLWQGASALAIGGLGATPLKLMADGLARWATDAPSAYLWMQENWQDSADEIYFGLPALLGASLQASSTVPGTDIRQDLTNLSNFVFLERAKAASKAVGAAWDLGTKADMNPLQDQRVVTQLIGAFAPRAVFRAYAAAEGEYIRSMSTGYPQVRGLSATTSMLYGMGFNQLEVDRQQVAARELFHQQEAQRSLLKALGQAYAGYNEVGDYEGAQRILDRAMMGGLSVTSVMKSAAVRAKREEEGSLFSRYDKQLAGRYTDALGVGQ